MKFISLFGGIGGFDLALKRLGHDCVFYNDFDKYAVQTYNKNNGTNYKATDIKQIRAETIPDHDILCGGFPCQAFSVAGKRRGFEDTTRGTLFFEIARIAAVKRPKYLFLENVKGLLNHEKGQTFATILQTLDELGYDAEWQVLNSKDFGVPQNRERVFIIGHLRGSSVRPVFPFGRDDTNTFKQTQGQIFEVTQTIRARYGNGDGSHIIQINNPVHSNNRVYSSDGCSPTLRTMQGGNQQPFILQRARGFNRGGKHSICPTMSTRSFKDNNLVMMPVLTPDRINKKQNGRRFKTDGEPMFTLNTQDKHGVYDGVRIRRLTPIECERLQGFPDNWTEGVSNSQRYKQLGNAVTVNVIEEIGKRLEGTQN